MPPPPGGGCQPRPRDLTTRLAQEAALITGHDGSTRRLKNLRHFRAFALHLRTTPFARHHYAGIGDPYSVMWAFEDGGFLGVADLFVLYRN